MWDLRYAQEGYAYGTNPNEFLFSLASKLPDGPILSLGEGEGRNASYLASLGFKVTAVDSSMVGLQKAKRLAELGGTTIETIHADLADFEIGKACWSSIISIFCHLPKSLRKKVLSSAIDGLVDGGVLLLEAYTPRQLAFGTGGPKTEDLLVSPDELREELKALHFKHFQSIEREIHEGELHNGMSSVVQVFARKLPG